ncbi:putative chromate transport protein [Pontiella desulfatans]|uniref:Putative chromate transport protein n=1 Tax=Pontiella desulfatans TaxID=2750659 RepID=A0A6C2U4R6_PONDE|nr:chromate transporter [Pontiella desulfatans]VGO14970.1 putative chromate transport protein [Pontiella desulfatans]
MAEQRERPRLLELFCVFGRISAITIGGGYVMFPLMKSEVVDSKGWATDEEMVDYYALGQSIPGIIAMNTATLVGYRKRGMLGALFAAAGMAAPSLGVILVVAAFLTPYFDHPWVQKAFAGIRAAVVAMIVMAVWQVGRKSVNSISKGVIALGSFLAIVGLHIHPVLMIVAAGCLGAILFRKEVGA